MIGELSYDYPLYRPPAEANSVIIQATYGCSYNNCSFCSMYKTKSFTVRPIEELFKEVDILAFSEPDATKIFLADGDALALKTEYLLELLRYIQEKFIKLRRISVYASAQNILDKSLEELKVLRENKLNLFYYGIETGSDKLLKKITKGISQQEMIDSLNKISDSGVKVSATVILGLGGSLYSKEHMIELLL